MSQPQQPPPQTVERTRTRERLSQALKSGVVYGLSAVNSITPHVAGAVDIVMIQQPDGSRRCSPFYVRFGKYTTLRTKERHVQILINGRHVEGCSMHLGSYGQAYFAAETIDVEGGDAEVEAQRAEALLAGMMSPESGYSSGDDEASVQVQAAQVVHAVREEVAAAQAAAAGAAAARHPRPSPSVSLTQDGAADGEGLTTARSMPPSPAVQGRLKEGSSSSSSSSGMVAGTHTGLHSLADSDPILGSVLSFAPILTSMRRGSVSTSSSATGFREYSLTGMCPPNRTLTLTRDESFMSAREASSSLPLGALSDDIISSFLIPSGAGMSRTGTVLQLPVPQEGDELAESSGEDSMQASGSSPQAVQVADRGVLMPPGAGMQVAQQHHRHMLGRCSTGDIMLMDDSSGMPSPAPYSMIVGSSGHCPVQSGSRCSSLLHGLPGSSRQGATASSTLSHPLAQTHTAPQPLYFQLGFPENAIATAEDSLQHGQQGAGLSGHGLVPSALTPFMAGTLQQGDSAAFLGDQHPAYGNEHAPQLQQEPVLHVTGQVMQSSGSHSSQQPCSPRVQVQLELLPHGSVSMQLTAQERSLGNGALHQPEQQSVHGVPDMSNVTQQAEVLGSLFASAPQRHSITTPAEGKSNDSAEQPCTVHHPASALAANLKEHADTKAPRATATVGRQSSSASATTQATIASISSGVARGISADVNLLQGLQLSLCGALLSPDMAYADVLQMFEQHRVSDQQFFTSPSDVYTHPDLVARLGRVVYPWAAVAPCVLGVLAFGVWRVPAPGTPCWAPPESAEGAESMQPDPRADVGEGSRTTPKKSSASWLSWPFGGWRDGTRTGGSFSLSKSPPMGPAANYLLADRKGSGPAALATASSAAAAAAVHNERRALSALGTSPPHALAHSGSSSGSLAASTPHGLATQSAPPAGLASGSPTASLDASRISLSVSGPPGQGLTHGSGRVRYRHTVITRKSLIPTPEQLEALPLHEGRNTITYKIGGTELTAYVYYLPWQTRIVISDIDGTITRSDVLGHLLPAMGLDWSHAGIAQLLTNIRHNGYLVMYLSSRSISQASITRDFINTLVQGSHRMPIGPVIISPHGLIPSLYREMILRRPHEFKIATLQDIRALFPAEWNPFYGGFGNRDTDEISYREVGMHASRIFIINPKGELRPAGLAVRSSTLGSLKAINELVHDIFPPLTANSPLEALQSVAQTGVSGLTAAAAHMVGSSLSPDGREMQGEHAAAGAESAMAGMQHAAGLGAGALQQSFGSILQLAGSTNTSSLRGSSSGTQHGDAHTVSAAEAAAGSETAPAAHSVHRIGQPLLASALVNENFNDLHYWALANDNYMKASDFDALEAKMLAKAPPKPAQRCATEVGKKIAADEAAAAKNYKLGFKLGGSSNIAGRGPGVKPATSKAPIAAAAAAAAAGKSVPNASASSGLHPNAKLGKGAVRVGVATEVPAAAAGAAAPASAPAALAAAAEAAPVPEDAYADAEYEYSGGESEYDDAYEDGDCGPGSFLANYNPYAL